MVVRPTEDREVLVQLQVVTQNELVDQLVDHRTFNAGVVGSYPTGFTKYSSVAEWLGSGLQNRVGPTIQVRILSGVQIWSGGRCSHCTGLKNRRNGSVTRPLH